MTVQREATLEELLSESIIMKVMERDGVRPADIRALIQQALSRVKQPRHQSPYTLTRGGERTPIKSHDQAGSPGTH